MEGLRRTLLSRQSGLASSEVPPRAFPLWADRLKVSPLLAVALNVRLKTRSSLVVAGGLFPPSLSGISTRQLVPLPSVHTPAVPHSSVFAPLFAKPMQVPVPAPVQHALGAPAPVQTSFSAGR